MRKFMGIANFRRVFPAIKNWKLSARLSFFILGITSTLWFLIRVIPKPSRATYPCMRAAAPIMSGFVIYLLSISASFFAFRKFGKKLMSAKYIAAAAFLMMAIVFVFISIGTNNSQSKATIYATPTDFVANKPIGKATGLKPGRVVWIYNPDATNEDCTNTSGDYWYDDANTDQDVVSNMLADGIKWYVGTNSLKDAWDSLFRYFNVKHGKGNVGYTTGEKIVIKVNMTNMGTDTRTLGAEMNNTPQMMFALLQELIDTLGIPQANITMGDPYRSLADVYYNLLHGSYPNVHYIDGSNEGGREYTQISTANYFFTSDNSFSGRLPQCYLDAAYLINMPCLKSHNSAGITLAAKNHQGSMITATENASNQYMGDALHYDYPDNEANQVYHIYRHLVDYIAHSKLGGNTLVYLVDAIWSGRNWNGYVDKWGMPPFNGQYTSSVFVSQDPVATESVGFDFLYNEYYSYQDTYHGGDDFPMWYGVDDYIRQAADSANWPSGIKYDPDHTDHHAPFASLGAEEHWNNITDKKYTRNLRTGNGIELVSVVGHVQPVTSIPGFKSIDNNLLIKCFPNPTSDLINVEYYLDAASEVNIKLYSMNGMEVADLYNSTEPYGTHRFNTSVSGKNLASGEYICRLTAISNGHVSNSSVKIQIIAAK